MLAAAGAAVGVILTRGGGASLLSLPPGVAIVDASSGRPVSSIPWAELKWPAEVTTGDGSFWVLTLDGYSLVRIDPKNGRVLGRVSSPFGSNALGWLVDGRSVWFSGPHLARMDVSSGNEANRFYLTGDQGDDQLAGLARGGGSLWVARQHPGELLRVDPTTGAVQHRVGNLSDAYIVAYGDGAAWVSAYDSVARVDAATNTVTRVPLPPPIAEIVAGGGFGWASNEARGRLQDRSGWADRPHLRDRSGAREMSYADGTLWVVNQDIGTLTGIDAATGARRTFRFGHPLEAVAALHGKLLVEINQGRYYDDRINALTGKVVRLIDPTYEFDHPDPAISGNGFVHSFMFQAERATCAPLLAYPDAPPPRGQMLVPEVAAAVPTLSADRRTYTFTVRDGFRFAPPSNAVLDAQTFRYSIERALIRGLDRERPASTTWAIWWAHKPSTSDARDAWQGSTCAVTASRSR